MKLTTPKRAVSDAENKLRLLYCVGALEQVAETQLWPFVASLDLMEYVPMQLLLHELLSGGDLHRGAEALEGILSLSPRGQETLGLFARRIMASDRRRIDEAAPAYRARLKRQRQIRASYEFAREGDYHVLLSLRESELPTLTLRVATPVRAYAMRSLQAFEEKAASLLLYLYGPDNACRDGEAGASPEGADPEGADPEGAGLEGADPEGASPRLTFHSPRECTVTALLSREDARFELSLLLPGREAAERFQRRLSPPGRRREAAERLFALLCQPD